MYDDSSFSIFSQPYACPFADIFSTQVCIVAESVIIVTQVSA